MKRTTVSLDEKLLEKAKRTSGERTYTAAITKALEEYVRKHDFWTAYKEWAEDARKGGMFEPGYLEELRPASRAVWKKREQRISAHEKRAPQKKTRRGSR
ncbi:MAG TPA: type II toxin-antitoxin system VapB family antitoxin [Thermoanaerobaculia bacterium]|nr:type II toxin-antitoxin system VapB family antitoxin [Thermoanaerobaculia bacterium]